MMTAAELIAFEAHIAELWEAGKLPYLLHLCGGNESQLLEIFREIEEGDWIFSTHRSHYHALLAGVPPARLEMLIRQGDSMFIFHRERNFLSSAILAGNCCIAAGVALALKEEGSDAHVWCFLGDGAEENGHFAEAVLMAEGHNLPITFVIEDNDRSVDTTLAERVPTGFRIHWPACVRRYSYVPRYPHAGNGTAKVIQFEARK